MIEHCNNCDKEHETGNLPPFEGVPVVTCPVVHGKPYDRMYPLGYARAMYRMGYLKCIAHPMLEPDRHIRDYRMAEIQKLPPLRGFAYTISNEPRADSHPHSATGS